MANINRAYEVLGDAAKRAAYDKSRGAARGTYEEPSDDQMKAFDESLAAVEQRWSIAVGVFPQLVSIRQRLSKTSHQLAFSFVTVLLETRRFHEAEQVAASMEESFLQRYFGTNQKILAFARELIAAGRKDAVRTLNQLVDVLGSDVDPDPIISKVVREHNVGSDREQATEADASDSRRRTRADKIQILKSKFLADPYYGNAILLAAALDLKVSERGGGFFSPIVFEIRRKDSPSPLATLTSTGELIDWVKRHLVDQDRI